MKCFFLSSYCSFGLSSYVHSACHRVHLSCRYLLINQPLSSLSPSLLSSTLEGTGERESGYKKGGEARNKQTEQHQTFYSLQPPNTIAIKMFKTDSQLSNPRQSSSHIDVLMQVSGADSKCRKHWNSMKRTGHESFIEFAKFKRFL